MLGIVLMYMIFGAITGVLAGLLGVGGGLVLVPLFALSFKYIGFPPEIIMYMALGTSLACIILTSISSARSHHQKGGVDWSIVKKITLGILIGTTLGSLVASKIPSHFLQIFFACFLCFVAYQMIMDKKPKPSRHIPGFLGTNLVGIGIGIVSSLVGIGGGTLSVPFMVMHNIDLRRAIGTSAAIGLPIAVSGGITYLSTGFFATNLPEYSIGYIYLPAFFGIVVFSMLTAPIGAKLAHSLPIPTIKKCFSVLLIIVAIRMFVSAL